jgi:hypothetical protein
VRAAGTRLPSEVADYKIESSRGWLIVAIVLLLAVGGSIAAIVLWT